MEEKSLEDKRVCCCCGIETGLHINKCVLMLIVVMTLVEAGIFVMKKIMAGTALILTLSLVILAILIFYKFISGDLSNKGGRSSFALATTFYVVFCIFNAIHQWMAVP